MHGGNAERLASKPRILDAARERQRLTRFRPGNRGDMIPLLRTDVHDLTCGAAISGRLTISIHQRRFNVAPLAVWCFARVYLIASAEDTSMR
jgi:hypothetical protein